MLRTSVSRIARDPTPATIARIVSAKARTVVRASGHQGSFGPAKKGTLADATSAASIVHHENHCARSGPATQGGYPLASGARSICPPSDPRDPGGLTLRRAGRSLGPSWIPSYRWKSSIAEWKRRAAEERRGGGGGRISRSGNGARCARTTAIRETRGTTSA